MGKVNIKPLSVNKAWQGRRFKTPDYKAFEQEMMLKLPSNYEVPPGELVAVYEFGVSSKLFDWDNPIKPVQDVLQKKYDFDDRHIVHGIASKVQVKKGAEYIRFGLYQASRGLDTILRQAGVL